MTRSNSRRVLTIIKNDTFVHVTDLRFVRH